MATKKLDVVVSKEGIERNFKLLNALLDSINKQIAALQSPGETGLSDKAKAEFAAIISGYKTEISTYIQNVLGAIGFNLDDYNGTFASITAREYITFLIVDDAGEEKAKFWYNQGTNCWQIAYDGGEPFDIGDMLKSVYDTNDNGEVDIAEMARTVEFIELDPEPVDKDVLVYDGETGKFRPGEVPAICKSLDGGAAFTVYLPFQNMDGGSAITVYTGRRGFDGGGAIG